MNFLSFLNTKNASVACWWLAIASRVVNVLYVSFAGRDKMALVLQSKSLLDGRGLSIPQYFVDNIDTPVYDYTPFWPPGYPVLLSPFLKIFNYDIYWSTTTLDIIFCILFVLAVRMLTRQLGFPVAASNVMTVIAGCFEYPFIYESLPTDTIALTFFLFGLLLTLRVLQSADFSLQKIAAASFFVFLPCLFRYAYPPASIVIPAAVLFLGMYNKDKLLIKKGVYSLAIVVFLTGAFFILLNTITGHTGYVAPTERGIYFQNIIHWFPFGPASFINLPFLTSQLIRVFNLPFAKSMSLLEAINILMVIAFLTLFVFLFFKKKFFAAAALHSFRWFLFIGLPVAMAIFAGLGYLSFTFEIQKRFENRWNYIYEPRYFAFVTIYIQLLFAGWVFLYPQWKNIRWQKTIVFVFSALLFIEITHNIYFNTKVALHFKQYKSAVFQQQDYNYFDRLIRTLIKENPGVEILAAADRDHYHPYIAAFYNQKGLFDGARLNQHLPAVKKKTILLLMIYDQEIQAYENFLANKNVKKLNKTGYANYYLLELAP